jgi:prepilin-type N-terminal cleavage/methylation domain-containing protein
MTHPAAHSATSTDAGFSLIEIVVSMFILALFAVALLPLLVQGLKQSSQTATIASAIQLANGQLDLARAQASTCTALGSTPAVAVGAASLYRGVPLQVTKTVGACPNPVPTATTPGTVTFTVTVTRTDTSQNLAQLTTRIYVNGG